MKLYLTKQENQNTWHYLTKPRAPTSIQAMGVVEVDLDEIRVDEWGSYVYRTFE